MIRANEFRIGNWVEARDGKNKSYVQVDGFLFWHFQLANADGGQAIEINSVYPIPLTSEILEACGFELKEDRYFEKGRVVIYDFGGGIYTLYQYVLPEIKYLHQLQNLYFALTGTELEIKLPFDFPTK